MIATTQSTIALLITLKFHTKCDIKDIETKCCLCFAFILLSSRCPDGLMQGMDTITFWKTHHVTVTVFCCESLCGINILWCSTMLKPAVGSGRQLRYSSSIAAPSSTCQLQCSDRFQHTTCCQAGKTVCHLRDTSRTSMVILWEWSKPRANCGCTMRICEAQRERLLHLTYLAFDNHFKFQTYEWYESLVYRI